MLDWNKRIFTLADKITVFVVSAFNILILLIFMFLSQYSNPAADDFCMAAGITESGALSHLWEHYKQWSGRYSGNALYGLLPLLFGLREGYFLIPILLITSLYLAFSYFLSAIFRLSIFKWQVAAASLCLVCVYMIGMKSTATGFYWMAGALTYQTGNILLLVIIGLSFNLYDRQLTFTAHKTYLLLLMTTIFVAMGLNETVMLAITCLIIAVNFYIFFSRTASIRPWLIILTVTLISFCIVYFAPGNEVRSSRFPHRNDILLAISGTWDYGLGNLLRWLSSPALIAASMLSLYFANQLYKSSHRILKVNIKLVIVLFFLILATPFALSFPAWWAMGVSPPDRTNNVIYFIFLLNWFTFITSVLVLIRKHSLTKYFIISINLKASFIIIAGVLYILSISASNNYVVALNDLFNNAPFYSEYLNKRYTTIENSLNNSVSSLILPSYNYKYPKSIYFDDITINTGNWSNVCYAKYFNLDQVSREYRFDGCSLYTIIGETTPDCTLVPKPGSADGHLSYGPYVQLNPGNYVFAIKYTSNKNTDTMIGKWDVAITTDMLVGHQLASGNLFGTDGHIAEIKKDFTISNKHTDAKTEIRNYISVLDGASIHSIWISRAE